MRNIVHASLVQIHYHNRTGGVTRVMESYADEFGKIYGPKSVNMIICHSQRNDKSTAAEIVNIKQCDYHKFRSIDAFCRTRDAIVHQIEKVFGEKISNFPVFIICHNLNLGKNPALSSAISLISRKLPFEKYRIFLVVHDMAEDGRVKILQNLRLFSNNRIDIKKGKG